MTLNRRELFIFAGPNGSGKSSFLSAQLPGGIIFLNPDIVSRNMAESKGLSPEEVQRTVYQGGHSLAALKRVRQIMGSYLRQGISFAIETALNNESYKNVMRQAQGNGYRVHLWFVGTRSAEVNLDRVRRRFFKGGHDVPKKDIVKRYEGGCERLKGYIELADEARIYDNSIENAPEPRLVLRAEKGEIVESVPDIPRWVEENVVVSSAERAFLQSERRAAWDAAQKDARHVLVTDAICDRTYTEKIEAVTGIYVVQEIAGNHAVLHRREDLDAAELNPGEHVGIRYIQGRGRILRESFDRREQDRGRLFSEP